MARKVFILQNHVGESEIDENDLKQFPMCVL